MRAAIGKRRRAPGRAGGQVGARATTGIPCIVGGRASIFSQFPTMHAADYADGRTTATVSAIRLASAAEQRRFLVTSAPLAKMHVSDGWQSCGGKMDCHSAAETGNQWIQRTKALIWAG